MVRANSLNSIAQTFVYVDPQTGSDTLGNGSLSNPYATITQANTSITDNATGKRYTIILMGSTSEAAVTVKPWVNIAGISANSSRIAVTGVGNNITLDATWTAPASVTISNISCNSATNFNFDTSAQTGTLGSTITLFNVDVTGGFTWNGKALNNADELIIETSLIDGAVSLTNANLSSLASTFASVTFQSTSGHGAITWTSQVDSVSGNITISETAADTTTALFQGDAIAGAISISGASASSKLDNISYPQGGFSLTSGSTISNFASQSAGAVTYTNKVNNSNATNQTLTSSSTSVPVLSGRNLEAFFDSLSYAGTISGNWTGTNTPVQNALNGFIAVQLTTVGNGNQLTYTTPGNLAVGVYMIEYSLIMGNIAGIADITYQANGAAFANLRSGVDLYFPGGDGFSMNFKEYITVTVPGHPLALKFTANGKNASSTNFWVRPCDHIRGTLLG